MKRYKYWTKASCPRECGRNEDQWHTISCRKADTEWEELIEIFAQWSASTQGPPSLPYVFEEGLCAWRERRSPDFSSPMIPADVCRAADDQTRIGWKHALHGRVSNKWTGCCNKHFISKGSRKSGRRHMEAIIRKLWDVAWDMWDHRNHVYLSTPQSQWSDALVNLDRVIYQQYETAEAELSDRYAHMFDRSPEGIVDSPLDYKQAWLGNVATARLHHHRLRKHELDLSHVYDALRRDFGVNSKPKRRKRRTTPGPFTRRARTVPRPVRPTTGGQGGS